MSDQLLQGVDQIDWAKLGIADVPKWLRALTSDNKKIRGDAYSRLDHHVINLGSESPEDFGPLTKVLATEAPLLIVPFLIALLKSENTHTQSTALDLLDSLTRNCHESAVDVDETLKKRANEVYEAVGLGVDIYRSLLLSEDRNVRAMAREILLSYQS